MVDPQKGVWLLPSRNRPESLRRFFDAYKKTKATMPVLILCDQTDAYALHPLPENFQSLIVSGDCFADAMSEGYEWWCKQNGEPEWIGWLADDNVPETEHWDAKLLEHVKGWNVVNSNDGWQANADITKGRLHGAVVWSGGLLRAVGYMFPPRLKHMFTDDVWESLGRETGCWQTVMGVMVRHVHASKVGAHDETERHTNKFWDNDEAAFKEWLSVGKKQAVAKIFALMQSCGVKRELPDLSGKSVMLATPAGDGKYDRAYMKAWKTTIDYLEECGAAVEWIEMPGCADLAWARARLLGTFYRSSYTHFMQIDSDQGWNPIDVVRLLQCNRDYVGAAGPMKKYPLTFCVNFEARGVRTEGGMGMMEAVKVGGAFVMLSRSCVDRMIAAYPNMACDTEHGEVEYALYDPLIAVVDGKRFRFSEDYSFAYRWKAIGGKIFILPDIRLQHIGNHCFEGALSDIFNRVLQIKEAAE